MGRSRRSMMCAGMIKEVEKMRLVIGRLFLGCSLVFFCLV